MILIESCGISMKAARPIHKLLLHLCLKNLVDMDIESVNSDGEQSERYDWADDLFVHDEPPPISPQLQTCQVNSPDVDDTETLKQVCKQSYQYQCKIC